MGEREEGRAREGGREKATVKAAIRKLTSFVQPIRKIGEKMGMRKYNIPPVPPYHLPSSISLR